MFNIDSVKVSFSCSDLLRLISIEEKEHRAVKVNCERCYTLLQTFVAMKAKNWTEGDKWSHFPHHKAKQNKQSKTFLMLIFPDRLRAWFCDTLQWAVPCPYLKVPELF
jgi:hypothetical protein